MSNQSLAQDDPLFVAPSTQDNGVDVSKLSPQELKLYRLYGKLPKKSDILNSRLKDRKYFDSGDYAMSKAQLHQQQEGQQAGKPNSQFSAPSNPLDKSAQHQHLNVFETGNVGSINPLQNPKISDISRINRNSISGAGATGILSLGTSKSQLENEASVGVFEDDDDDEAGKK